jgi:chorismate mutase / prephenate dehydrogenase
MSKSKSGESRAAGGRKKAAGVVSRDADLARIRDSIGRVDRELLGLLRHRMDLAAEVGRIKAEEGLPIVIRDVEHRVLDRARRYAEECGVSTEVMGEIYNAILRGSVERQHRIGVAARARRGGRVLILGAAGEMGTWFSSFLRLVGHRVGGVDPAWAGRTRAAGRFGSLDLVPDLDAYDFILVTAPLNRTGDAIADIAARRPRKAIVIEIASIKSHITAAHEESARRGVRTLSLHPMFGPGKSPYEPMTFVLAHRSDPDEEMRIVERLLRHPYTSVIPIPFDHHDRLMGWLLGLAHLTGIVFGSALARSGLDHAQLWACASTTFSRQAATALSILSEDPALYLDIQRLNPHRDEVYAAAHAALDEIVATVDHGDLDGFRRTFESAKRFVVGV